MMHCAVSVWYSVANLIGVLCSQMNPDILVMSILIFTILTSSGYCVWTSVGCKHSPTMVVEIFNKIFFYAYCRLHNTTQSAVQLFVFSPFVNVFFIDSIQI